MHASIALMIVTLTSFANVAFAQIAPPSKVGILEGGGLIGVMCTVASWVFAGAIIFAIILAILIGIQYMTSSGDKEKVQSAHRRIVYLVVGIAVAILAQTLPVLVGSFVGASNQSSLGVCS